MPLIRFPTPAGLVYTIDLSKIPADRENPRTVESPLVRGWVDPVYVDWGDGTTELLPVTTESNYSHTYPEGSGEVFTVVIRSVRGRIPHCYFSQDISQTQNPTFALTSALISIDHFAGMFGPGNPYTSYGFCANARNLEYIDTRVIGGTTVNDLTGTFRFCSKLKMSMESFCFDFCAFGGNNFSNAFGLCIELTGAIPEGMFDNAVNCITVANMFSGCAKLTAPYKFWESSYAAAISSTSGCYNACTGMDLTQIPSAYGGTMTV